MIIGCKDIDFTLLRKACRTSDSLLHFAMDCIPTPLLHIPEVVANQKYFIALQVRSIKSLPWQKRKELCDALLDGVKIKGVSDTFYDYTDLLLAIDCEAFKRYLLEDRKDAEG